MVKIRVWVVFGGKTPEHEVSLQSAKNIIEAIDKDLFEIIPIGINKEGRWLLQDSQDYLENAIDPKSISLKKTSKELALTPGSKNSNITQVHWESIWNLDVIFPVIHGINGEDGSIQWLLQLLEIPFVGPGILGSAVAMDKDITKRLLHLVGINVAKWVTLYAHKKESIDYDDILRRLKTPLFVKPANMGSSVGVSKVSNKQDLIEAVASAFEYDNKILIEQWVKWRELECAILGNDTPQASAIGEVILSDSFYSYKTKYISDDGAQIAIPAKLDEQTIKKLQETAILAFQTIECSGMARVDFFLTPEGDVYVNEINTIPGFTNISMYPKLWEASGLLYTDLITKLLYLAIEKSESQSKLKKAF